MISILQKCLEPFQNVSYSVCSRLKQWSVMKFLVVEKCKQCEIYRKMCDAYREGCFCQKKTNFINGINLGLSQVSHKESRCRGNTRFLTQQSVKQVILDSLLGYEKTNDYC